MPRNKSWSEPGPNIKGVQAACDDQPAKFGDEAATASEFQGYPRYAARVPEVAVSTAQDCEEPCVARLPEAPGVSKAADTSPSKQEAKSRRQRQDARQAGSSNLKGKDKGKISHEQGANDCCSAGRSGVNAFCNPTGFRTVGLLLQANTWHSFAVAVRSCCLLDCGAKSCRSPHPNRVAADAHALQPGEWFQQYFHLDACAK